MQTKAALTPPTPLPLAGLGRRLASLVYEGLLLAGVLLVAGFPLLALVQAIPAPWGRLVNQVCLVGVAGMYLVWFWRHGGQTLAMKTWRIRLLGASGGPVGLHQAWLRYGLALLGLFGLCIAFLWALWDRDRQFLHDRLAGTRLVSVPLDPPQGERRRQAEERQGGQGAGGRRPVA